MFTPILLLLLAGAAAGFLGGLLGIGGGLLVVAALSLALPALGVPKAEVMHVSVATSMATIVLTFVSSGAAHIRRGSVLWPTWRWLAPGMAAGGVVGAHLAQMLSGQTLRWVIAAFCAFMAWRMAYGKMPVQNAGKSELVPRSPWLLPAGAGIGAISAVAGIGGGSMTVPLLVSLGVKPVRAVGTSAVCGLAIALASALSYALTLHPLPQPLPWGAVGYLYVPAAAVVALASMALAPLGARIAHAISGVAIKRAFAVFLIVVGAVIVAGG
ncbi:MAG TPA: sulfite exporter TauE/SafE family protein [Steroidobacteraceae bacterium]|nr:sulfite exporter TauE/SafE family protein [Steroidobacteraceae bacterium]